MGTSISLVLNDLSAYKITLEYLVFTVQSGQSYTLTLQSDSYSLTSSSNSYSVCGSLYLHTNSINFSDIALNNTLTI